MASKGFRRERAAEQIRRELTEILAAELASEDLPSFYIHKVELTPDFGLAKALLVPATVDGELDEKAVAGPLRRITPRVRAELVKRLSFRRAPELRFQVDRGQAHQSRIETLLERIKKRGSSGGAALVLCLWSLGVGSLSAASEDLQRFEASAEIMGSTFRIAAHGPDRRRLASVVYSAFDEVRRLNAMLSNYREDSELSEINRRAADAPVEVSPQMARFLKACLAYSRASEGAFDITVGRLMETWGFFKGAGKLPGNRAIRQALEQVGYRQLQLDGRRVRFRRDGLLLDPGAVGKGYAVQRVAEWLRRYGVETAMISAGSSTLYALGAPPDDPRGWKVDIRSPADGQQAAATVYLEDESLSTSGSYEKFFTVDGVRYSHIMDPRTGRPALGTAAVSVLAPSALESEVWTTALFVLGERWAEENAPDSLRVFFCPTGAPCRWLEGR